MHFNLLSCQSAGAERSHIRVHIRLSIRTGVPQQVRMGFGRRRVMRFILDTNGIQVNCINRRAEEEELQVGFRREAHTEKYIRK